MLIVIPIARKKPLTNIVKEMTRELKLNLNCVFNIMKDSGEREGNKTSDT